MTEDNVWRSLPVEGIGDPQREELEIKVVPEEPDEHVMTAENVHQRQLEEARELARTDFVEWCVGAFTPRSELAHWSAPLREAYEAELERLKRERSR